MRDVDTIADKFRTPMPFMNNIKRLTLKDLKRSILVKGETRKWKKKLDKHPSPEPILDAIGKLMKIEARKVFNNPVYFPQAPYNLTPNFETGELLENFRYKNSISKSIKGM